MLKPVPLFLALGVLSSLAYWGWVYTTHQATPRFSAGTPSASGVVFTPGADLPSELPEVLNSWFFGSTAQSLPATPADPTVVGWLRSETQGSILLRWPDGREQAHRLGTEIEPGWQLQYEGERFFLRSTSGLERDLTVTPADSTPSTGGIQRLQ